MQDDVPPGFAGEKTGSAPLRSRRNGRPYRITPEVLRDICAFIRAGALPRTAAGSAGIPLKTFDEAIKRGRGEDHRRAATPWLRTVVAQLEEAMAHARLGAELEVKRLRPDKWLAADERGSWIESANINLTTRTGPPESLQVEILYFDEHCVHGPDCPICAREGRAWRTEIPQKALGVPAGEAIAGNGQGDTGNVPSA